MIIHYGDDRTKLSCRDISECLCGGMDGIDINDLPCDVSLCWGQTETVRRALNPWVSYEACGTACESQRMRQAFWQTTQQTDNQPVERIYIETVNGLSIFQIWNIEITIKMIMIVFRIDSGEGVCGVFPSVAWIPKPRQR